MIFTSPLSTCPNCAYSLVGLRPPHECPECGWHYEPETIAWSHKIGSRLQIARLSIRIGLLLLLGPPAFHFIDTTSGRRPALIFFAVIGATILSISMYWMVRSRQNRYFVALDRRGVTVGRNGQMQLIQLEVVGTVAVDDSPPWISTRDEAKTIELPFVFESRPERKCFRECVSILKRVNGSIDTNQAELCQLADRVLKVGTLGPSLQKGIIPSLGRLFSIGLVVLGASTVIGSILLDNKHQEVFVPASLIVTAIGIMGLLCGVWKGDRVVSGTATDKNTAPPRTQDIQEVRDSHR